MLNTNSLLKDCFLYNLLCTRYKLQGPRHLANAPRAFCRRSARANTRTMHAISFVSSMTSHGLHNDKWSSVYYLCNKHTHCTQCSAGAVYANWSHPHTYPRESMRGERIHQMCTHPYNEIELLIVIANKHNCSRLFCYRQHQKQASKPLLPSVHRRDCFSPFLYNLLILIFRYMFILFRFS